jgi:hypothetical protein
VLMAVARREETDRRAATGACKVNVWEGIVFELDVFDSTDERVLCLVCRRGRQQSLWSLWR